MVATATKLIESAGFKAGKAHCAIEAKPPVQWNKGRASIYILRTAFGLDWSERIKIIYVGDDVTDEDAMEALKGMAATFRVTQSQIVRTAADRRLPSTDSVLTMLKWLERHFCERLPRGSVHTEDSASGNLLSHRCSVGSMSSKMEMNLPKSISDPKMNNNNNNNGVPPMNPGPKFKPKPQACKVCGKVLSSASSYYVHMKLHSGNKPYHCTACDAAFCRKPYLEVHMRTHTGERPYECEICGKRFSQKSACNTHKRTHIPYLPRVHPKDKPFHCPACEGSFTTKQNLEVHMRTHTGERPFQCAVCSKRFTQKSSLNTHKRVHTGERPYACDICDKRFAVKSYVTSHRWSHVGDKPFGCTSCHLTFTSKSQFAVHLRTHHTVGANHVCNVCGRSFVRDSYLIRHQNKVHGERVSSTLPHIITPDHFLHLSAQAQSALFSNANDNCDVSGTVSPPSNVSSSSENKPPVPTPGPPSQQPPPSSSVTPPALMRINLQQVTLAQQSQLVQQAQQQAQRAQQQTQQACA
uniref:Zinc finger protein 300 n=1 Tax=Cacopsylla melanoneura TaxID=428564 RepID=A0A8D8UTB4_9HEMI